jgi:uncharacterized protein with ParB-like and HNH nuclease domain
MGSIANTIQAFTRTLKEILDGKKYQVDYFQREYKWETKHIEQLLLDLEASFLSNYEVHHVPEEVANYNSYYLGPIVLSEKANTRSIVDGQQRLTSLTLLLIYLNNRQKFFEEKEELESLIYSKKHSRKSYNIEVPDRSKVLDALFLDKEVDQEELSDESVQNMVDRYKDIGDLFPETLNGDKLLLMFIDWLKEKIVFVEIVAFSDENAYTIFETMNDRGLNLTPTEMLKSYVLTNVKDNDKIYELNQLWKIRISELHSISPQEDLEFMRAWLRGQYADSIRSRTKGSGNEDFEKIGTRFHTWLKDNHKLIGLKSSESFYHFVKSDFDFYSMLYMRIIAALRGEEQSLNALYLSSFWSIATSLSYPLFLSPIGKLDDERTITDKIICVSKFIDLYSVYRTLGDKPITQSAIRYSIYLLVKRIRNKELPELRKILKEELLNSAEIHPDLQSFNATIANDKFVKYLLARITFHVENEYLKSGIDFYDLIVSRKKNRYVVSPLVWQFSFDEYKDIYESEEEYDKVSSQLGNYLFVPNPVHLLISDISDESKLSFLRTENYLSSCATRDEYRDINLKFGIEKINSFSKEEIESRTIILGKMINEVWNVDDI